MKFTDEQFTEIAFIFEKYNGANHGDYEKQIIAKSQLTKFQISELKSLIIDGLNSNIYLETSRRVSAYWALSKTNDKNLVPEFKKWLQEELINENTSSVFQILIALDRLDEPAFHKDRNSRYYDDVELNIRDAKNYLENN